MTASYWIKYATEADRTIYWSTVHSVSSRRKHLSTRYPIRLQSVDSIKTAL